MGRAHKTIKPRRSKRSGKRKQKLINANLEVLKKLK
jgi:hypothetical protein